jgi:hypothetical protein
MGIGLQQQLDAVGLVRADDGEPPVLAQRDVGLGTKPSMSV